MRWMPKPGPSPTDLAEARRLWAAAAERYAQALAIKPDKHEAAYNWGNALDAEARAVAPTDLAEARRLWAAAAERYAQALAIKPDA
jgi:tetratricopeptide (TPR) repeat protein